MKTSLFTQPLVLFPVLAIFEIGFIQREAYVALLLLVLSTPLQFGTNLFLYIYLVSFQEVEVRLCIWISKCERNTEPWPFTLVEALSQKFD